MAPDERALQADLTKARFRLGQAEGRWRLIGHRVAVRIHRRNSKMGARMFCASTASGIRKRPHGRPLGHRAECDPGLLTAGRVVRGAASVAVFRYKLEERFGSLFAV